MTEQELEEIENGNSPAIKALVNEFRALKQNRDFLSHHADEVLAELEDIKRFMESARQAVRNKNPHGATIVDFIVVWNEHYEKENAKLRAEIERLQAWVADLQSGMYVNCIYCGHRYGPSENTPVTMADVLKDHVERCPEHPMSKLKEENKKLKLARLREAIAVGMSQIESGQVEELDLDTFEAEGRAILKKRNSRP